ncbi:MAG: topoisomerase II [Actinomycetales bacterium]|nr:topoisomerase II [Actinomycetales bacterium]
MVKNTVDFVLRPFEGLPVEADLVAIREVVPSATIRVRTTKEHGAREVLLTTILPAGWPALHRSDGVLLVALQTTSGSGDASRDVAQVLLAALELEAGTPLEHAPVPEAGPRLQDVLDPKGPWDVEVLEGFDHWLADDAERTADVQAALEDENEQIIPTVKLESVESAYWCRMGGKEFLRWAQTVDDDTLLDGLARLHAQRASAIGDARFIGAFRSCGIVIPVWELARGTEPADLEGPVAEYWPSFEAALKSTEPLTADERRARGGLVARQVTLR